MVNLDVCLEIQNRQKMFKQLIGWYSDSTEKKKNYKILLTITKNIIFHNLVMYKIIGMIA